MIVKDRQGYYHEGIYKLFSLAFMKLAIKFTRKSVLIIMVSVGILCFAFVTGVLLSEYSYNGGIFERIEEVIDDTTTDNDTSSEPEQPDPSVGEISYVGEYKENVICQGTGYDFTIITNKDPHPVKTSVSLFKDTDKSKHIYDFDESSEHYEGGILSGTLNGNTIPEDTHYYIGVYQSYSYGAVVGWEKIMIRYFVLDSKIYILTGSIFYMDGDISISGEIYDEENQLQETGTLEENVVVLDSAYESSDDCFRKSTYLQKVITPEGSSTGNGYSYSYMRTDKNVLFDVYSNEYETLADVSGYTEVDSYNGLKILRNSVGKMVVEDREGFIDRAEMNLGWFDDGDDFTILFEDGSNSKYWYISEYGKCELNPEGSYTYAYEDVNSEELEYIGTAYGSSVYQKKNMADDSFTNKLYEEDYVDGEYWKINNLTVDDNGAISFDDYLTYHPVIYIKDPYGYYIRLTNAEFYASGGCAKPAIYLYPEETTDISVKVIPNGRLIFTLPRYDNGWSVRVSPNGNITNLIDGKLYEYLWWDSVSYGFEKPDGGFVVSKEDVSNFLTQKLVEMNLNSNEISDFKEYWVPKLTSIDSDQIYISFLFNEEVNQIARLEVSPSPKNIFRVFMIYKPVEGDTIVKPLYIESANRDGYTLIEWGGAEI